MADVIDLALHRASNAVVTELLEERGLAFFMKRGGGVPFALDARRIKLAIDLAAKRVGHEVAAEAKKTAFDAQRKRLIGFVARALVSTGL